MYRRYFVVLPVTLFALSSLSANARAQDVQRDTGLLARNKALERRITELEKQVANLTQRLVAVETLVEQPAIGGTKLRNRSADLTMLKTQLQSKHSLRTLHKRFQMGSSTHADYPGPGPEVGGSPASVMTFFRDSRGRYYRVFDRKRIELIEKPAPWLRRVVDSATPPPEPKSD